MDAVASQFVLEDSKKVSQVYHVLDLMPFYFLFSNCLVRSQFSDRSLQLLGFKHLFLVGATLSDPSRGC